MKLDNVLRHLILWPTMLVVGITFAATPTLLIHYFHDKARWERNLQEGLDDFQWKHRDLVLIAGLQQTNMFDEEAFHQVLVSLYSTQTQLRWERDINNNITTKLILDSYVETLIDIKYKVYDGDSIEYDMMFIEELYTWLEANL